MYSATTSSSSRDGDRGSRVKKPYVKSQQNSQLPQRSSARQSSICRESLADIDVSNITREALCEPGAESNLEVSMGP